MRSSYGGDYGRYEVELKKAGKMLAKVSPAVAISSRNDKQLATEQSPPKGDIVKQVLLAD